MGFLTRLAGVAAPAAGPAMNEYNRAFWSGDSVPDLWMARLGAAGVPVSPDLARTLTAYACGVDTIAYDLGTLPLRAFKTRPDGGTDPMQGSASGREGGIGALIYRLQWQPNDVQTAAEFYPAMIAQLKMREVAYAEIVPGPGGFADQLLPRHPDRVTPERLPNGRIRYTLAEANGGSRYVTQDEMFVIRGLSFNGGLTPINRTAYAASMLSTALAAEQAAGRFFRTGMTAALLATYPGDQKEDDDEAALHRAISRYASGVENSFGLMLVPDDVKITNLSIDPQKAQMMDAREWTVYEVARELRISPRKLMARDDKGGYASAYQEAIDHVSNCLRPIAVIAQQAIQRDLVLAKDTYRFIFHLGELLKGDPQQMGEFIEKLIRNRAMTPSEVRMTYLDMNPDPHLDQLSEGDNRPGGTNNTDNTAPSPSAPSNKPPKTPSAMGRADVKGLLVLHDNALMCLRRERASVTKLAEKHANQPVAFRAALRDFYAEHAGYVSRLMRLHPTVARGYAAEHGTSIEAQGIIAFGGETGEWERAEADELTILALSDGDRIEDWFADRPAPAAVA